MELEATVEHLEHAAHGPVTRLRSVVTLLIVALTAVGALVSYAAARANTHAEEASRQRSLQVAVAQREDTRVAGLLARSSELDAQSADAYTRSAGTSNLVAKAPQAAQAALQAEADRYSKVGDALSKANPGSEAGYAEAQRRAGTEAEQRALVLGESTEVWVHKEDVYVGVLGILAVSLFLLGLSLTVPVTRIRVGFVVVALALAGWSAARGWSAERRPQPALRPAALTAYLDGAEHAGAGKPEVAVTDLQKAVAADHEYSQAWIALGDAYAAVGKGDEDYAHAVEAYRTARETGALPTPKLANNLAFAELLLGRVDAAATDSESALRLAPEDPAVLSTQAEVALARHDLPRAMTIIGRAVDAVGGLDADYRNTYLDSQQADAALFATRHLGTDAEREQYFSALRDSQASLDAFASRTPRDTHGATLSDLAVSYDGTAFRLHVRVREHGHVAGDVVSVRVFSGGSYLVDASQPTLTPTGGDEVTVDSDSPLYEGTYRVEVYLNGHYQAQAPLTATYTG